MKKVELHPEVFIINHFLSPAECEAYILKGEQAEFEEAKVNLDGKQTMLKGVRNNQRILFKDDQLAASLWNKIQPYVPENLGLYEASGCNEMFRIYKYTEGQRFKMHRDGSYERSQKERSFYTFLIYLNDDFEGGETYFKEGITVEPVLGTALLFHHPMPHEGKRIDSGTKYVLRTDIMYKSVES